MAAIGLTGGIGSGKSSVSQLLAARGAVIVDADIVARQVLEPGGSAHLGVVERFGSRVVRADGTVDRTALAAIVFGDASALADLNALTHPAVRRAMLAAMAAEPRGRVVVADIPLLAEGGRDRWPLDGVIVVDTPVELALDRLVASGRMDRGSARARVAAQASREQRLAVADFVIDNSTDLAGLTEQVERAWEWIACLCPRAP